MKSRKRFHAFKVVKKRKKRDLDDLLLEVQDNLSFKQIHRRRRDM
jgi:hypothetical protein